MQRFFQRKCSSLQSQGSLPRFFWSLHSCVPHQKNKYTDYSLLYYIILSLFFIVSYHFSLDCKLHESKKLVLFIDMSLPPKVIIVLD